MSDLSQSEDWADREISRRRVERLTEAFEQLDGRELQLLTCALAGNHPEHLGDLRYDVLRALAKAERSAFNAC